MSFIFLFIVFSTSFAEGLQGHLGMPLKSELQSQLLSLKWSDLDSYSKGDRLILNQSLNVPFSFNKGTKFLFQSVLSLDDIQVTIFEFLKEGCRLDENAPSTDIEMILVDGVSSGREVGVLLEKKCILSIFVEWDDRNSQSLFVN